MAGFATPTVGRQRGRREWHGQLRQPPADSSRQEMKESMAKRMKQTARRSELGIGRIEDEPIRLGFGFEQEQRRFLGPFLGIEEKREMERESN